MINSQLRWQSALKGVITYIPLFNRWSNSQAGSPVGARYFYSVWLRHLVKVASVRPTFSINVVAELGPGDALGIGICALLSGAQRYIGLDRIAFGLRADNLSLLDELASLFKKQTPIPDDREMPGVYPKLEDYRFPYHLITKDTLDFTLSDQRLERLRSLLQGNYLNTELFSYVAPWNSENTLNPASVDLLISQAVLEHVDDIEGAYDAMHDWLKPSGVMSHRIDYTSHGITRDWFGHWTISPRLWRIVRGRRSYLINRMPHSSHIAALKANGFSILSCNPTKAEFAASANEIRVQHISSDLDVKGAYIVAASSKL
jgi:hypothetical protein